MASQLPIPLRPDEVDRQVERAKLLLRPNRLVPCGPDQEPELLQLLQAWASVRVQVTLVEVLGKVRFLASEPLGG